MVKKNLEGIIEESFLNYSAFVLQRRAIPDVRDGMKYTARQILHAQYKDKLDAAHPFKKAQKSVAAATAFSYVHGDTSCYEQIVRMGRPLVQRYYMEEFHGNNGTPCASDDYSASRYTEARLSPLAMQCFEYINHDVLDDKDWSLTYDEEGKFPLVLPSLGFYGLCNGSFGSIGVGLISSIPQFNLKEMNAAIVSLIDDPKTEIRLLPDFASGGILMNPETTIMSLSKGEGKSALLRGKVVKYPKEGYLEVVELPYGVYTNTVCIELEKAKEKGNTLFTDVKDLSKKSVRIRIYTKECNEMEQWLYKNTSVQKYFTIKMILLRDGKKPKLYSLREAMLEHIKHTKKVLRKEYDYQLQMLKNRAEVIAGFIKLQSILDEVIAAIRACDGGKAVVVTMLRRDFEFSELQAEAIAERKLHQLSKFDIHKLGDELTANKAKQAEILSILMDEERFNVELKHIYKKVAYTAGDARKTEIATTDEWESSTTGKVEKDTYLYCSSKGYAAAYNRGDEDLAGIDESELVQRFIGDDICIVTSELRAISRKVGDLSLGRHRWDETINLRKGENVLMALSRAEFDAVSKVVITLANGTIQELHPSFITISASPRGKKILPIVSTAIEVTVIE